jgi:predicted ATP-dependent protease
MARAAMIVPGSIHRANGGFLVLQANEALGYRFVWQELKQALRSREARIESLGEQVKEGGGAVRSREYLQDLASRIQRYEESAAELLSVDSCW